jgi:hypothetical protein
MPKEEVKKVVDNIALSIRNLVDYLESRRKKGEMIKAAEVRAIASQLRIHVESLLSAERRLRGRKPSE